MSTGNSTPASEADFAWELATLYPEQGNWSEAAYLDLTGGANRRIELVDGRLEFLPLPAELHQALVGYLNHALLQFVTQDRLGVVPFPPLRVRVGPGRYREPDVLFLRNENSHLRTNRAWQGADLVMEVVSPDPKDRQRDYEAKPLEYAAARISEYWIVDPERQVVTVYRLEGEHYAVHGEFGRGQRAVSQQLDGFVVDVAELFAVADNVAE